MKALTLTLILAAGLFAADSRKDIDAGYSYRILPQIAAGAGWKTTVTMVNMEPKAVSWTLKFFSDAGVPKEFDLAGRGRSTVFAGVLQQNSALTLETVPSAALHQGWAHLSAGSDDLGSMVIFGTGNYEATVPAAYTYDDDVLIPFDNTAGYVTSLAVVNTSDYSDEDLAITVYDENGIIQHSEVLKLAKGNKVSFATPDRWPVSQGKRGTIAMKTDFGSVSSFALRFHPSGSFTTVFPLSK